MKGSSMNGNKKSFDQRKGKKPAPSNYRAEKVRAAAEDESVSDSIVIGRNPIRELLHSGRAIDKIFVQRGEREGSVIPLIAEAKKLGIVVVEVEYCVVVSITCVNSVVTFYGIVLDYSPLYFVHSCGLGYKVVKFLELACKLCYCSCLACCKA